MTTSRSPRALAALAILGIFAGTAAAGTAELNAKPGGKIELTYGTPSWRDEFESQINPQLTWRYGANSATRLETDAGMVFEDFVLFPGSYDVAVQFPSAERWRMVFHHDGLAWSGKTDEGTTTFPAARVSGKDVTRLLEIEFDKGKTPGAYVWRSTFGPLRFEQDFKTAKAKTVPGKVAKLPVELTYLERTDLDALSASLKKDQVLVAKLRKKKKDSPELKLFLRDEPLRLQVVPAAGEARLLEGRKAQPAAATKTFVGEAVETEDGATLRFVVGGDAYEFDLHKDLLESEGAGEKPARGARGG